MEKTILGLDIGGTKIEAAIFINGRVSTRARIPTKRELGHQSVIERIKDHIIKTLASVGKTLNDCQGIGVGLPGTIDPLTSVMINGNSEIFINRNFSQDLKSILNSNIEVRCANDANLFALAEVHRGAGLKFQEETGLSPSQQIGVGIILGTGNGGGLIINGEAYIGRHGGGAEVGHHVLYQNGRPCYCGRLGCAEQYLCGPSIEASYKEQTGESLMATEVFKKSSEEAITIQKQYQKDLIEFLTNLCTLFDPDYFVLGGGISTIDKIYEGLEEKLWSQVFVKGTRPKVYQHQIGDSAGVLGAAMLFKEHMN
ncbi:MAG: ROK family protein [Bacteriovoracaceae bacterium]|nr:ROK family protein [Bacteriovoracaceae bacterium]